MRSISASVRHYTGIRHMKKRYLGVAIIVWASCSYMPLLGEYMDNLQTSFEMSDTGPDTYPGLSAGREWNSFKSAYFTVYYLPQDDLKSVERKLRTRTLPSFGRNAYPDNVRSASEKIAYRLDMLYVRTKEILDTYPDIHIIVRIFKDRKELCGEYYRIYKKKRDLSSFYVNKDKTIYACEADISDSVIVGEMSRAVIDQDIGVILPAKVKDMFSSYVNSHLDE
jgi:hypothetical protein